ncbi:hypothetical protein HJFPF1_04971 [Paramyrothecium foliicola]|nr:hypothetical protein HJFPF1_04971 [Paramyrothecium foliicola]
MSAYPKDLDWTLLTQLAVLVRKTRDNKDGFSCKLSDDWSTGNSWFVFAHMRRDDPHNPITTDWMLMEFIPGNTVDDAWGGHPVHKGIYPPVKYVPNLYSGLAGHVAEISSLRFSKIGAIQFKNNRFEIGPIPGWGGPWDTAAEFFEAIANICSHIYSKGHRDQACGDSPRYAFPRRAISPYHRDLSSHNVVVDPDCNILGILEWHMAQTIPWEVAEFCDEIASSFNELTSGQPDPNHGNIELYAKTDFHKILRQAEEERNLDHKASEAQATQKFRTLAYAFHNRVAYCVEGNYYEVLKLFEGEN